MVMIYESLIPTPRMRRRAKNLELILENAMDLVVAHGWEGFSMHRLAKEVDYTPGALYRYFSSKDALISALVVRILEELKTNIEAQTARAPKDPLLQILLAIQTYQNFAMEAPHRFGLLAVMMADPKELLASDETAGPAVAAMLDVLGPLHEAVAELMGSHNSQMISQPQVSQMTLALFAGLQGALQLRKLHSRAPHIFDVTGISSSLTKTFLRGWGISDTEVELAFDRLSGIDSQSTSGSD